jgi:transposase
MQEAHPMPQAKQSRRREDLSPVHPAAAAIDIGATMHVAAVGPDRDPEPVRTFQTFTDDLHRLADWFAQCGINSVVMESTGVYWIPAYEILEQRGFSVMLVNARDAKHVPGRKTDVSDAQWLQRLHEYGLLRPSFRPQAEMAGLRAYLRQRERLLDYAAAHIQHMQKALTQMNLQLHHVVSDITGATGMRIIRAIVAGERDPAILASYRDVRCHASVETVRQALVGNDREEHIFALTQALELYDVYQAKVAACDGQIEAILTRLRSSATPPAEKLPAARQKARSTNAPAFEVREALHAILGVDLTQIHGLGPYLALKLVGECGTNLSAWPSAKHFTSWLGLAPHNKISGGKVLSSKTRRTSNRAATLLRLAAVTVGRTDTALGAFHRRLSTRAGKSKAITATARKIAVLFYNTLRHGMSYADPGASYYEERYRQRVLSNLKRRAKSMGFVLQQGEPAGAQAGVS